MINLGKQQKGVLTTPFLLRKKVPFARGFPLDPSPLFRLSPQGVSDYQAPHASPPPFGGRRCPKRKEKGGAQ